MPSDPLVDAVGQMDHAWRLASTTVRKLTRSWQSNQEEVERDTHNAMAALLHLAEKQAAVIKLLAERQGPFDGPP